jgi:predicted nucleic acid-binding protein
MIAIDTNLLVYAHRARTPQHGRARSAIEAAATQRQYRGRGVTGVLAGRHASRVRGSPIDTRGSRRFRARAHRRGRHEMPGPGFGERLLQTAAALGVSGPRIVGLQIAVTAFEGGATELWTHDGGFVAVPGLRVSDPLA